MSSIRYNCKLESLIKTTEHTLVVKIVLRVINIIVTRHCANIAIRNETIIQFFKSSYKLILALDTCQMHISLLLSQR
jgi:hypothetical protein